MRATRRRRKFNTGRLRRSQAILLKHGLGEAELFGGGRAGVAEERRAALGFLGLLDQRGRLRQRTERPQEPAVRLVLPRHRTLAAPAVPPERVEPAVIADPGERVPRQVLPGIERAL